MTGLNVKIVVSPAVAITEALDRTYDGAATPLQRIVEGMEDEGGPEGDEDVNHLRDMAFEAPVVRLVNLLVENAISSEASDIHIEPFEDTLRIRYRIDGILYEQEAPPRRLQAAVTSRIKIMAEMNIAERRLPQDGRIRVTLHGRRVDIRVSTMPTVHGESIVMRLLTALQRLPARSRSSDSRATPSSASSRSSSARTASCSSPGRPAPARPPPSTPRSTRSTAPA